MMIQMNHNPPVKNTITKSNNIPKQPAFFWSAHDVSLLLVNFEKEEGLLTLKPS